MDTVGFTEATVSVPMVRRFGDLKIDVGMRQVFRDSRQLDLTRLEFDLLMALIDAEGTICSPSFLLRKVWRHTWLGDEHVVETHVGRLRAKLGETGKAPRHIHTVRGMGYRFVSGREPVQTHHHLVYDASLVLLSVQPDHLSFLGWQPDEIVGRFVLFTDHDQLRTNQSAAIKWLQAMARTSDSLGPLTGGVIDRSGCRRTVTMTMRIMRCDSGDLHGLVVDLVDAVDVVDGTIAS